MTKEEALEEWLAEPERTEKVREVARKYPPWNTYRNELGQDVQIVAYAEDGTVRVNVVSFTIENLMGEMRQVFGMDPSKFEILRPETRNELPRLQRQRR